MCYLFYFRKGSITRAVVRMYEIYLESYWQRDASIHQRCICPKFEILE